MWGLTKLRKIKARQGEKNTHKEVTFTSKGTKMDKYLLLTEFKVFHTVSSSQSFFPRQFMAGA